MELKRRRSASAGLSSRIPPKRTRILEPPSKPETPARDVLSTLPNELIIRILSSLSERELLRIAPTSHRFRALASDSQLWRVHYYRRFVLPRAHRIPGFRAGVSRSETKLYYSSQSSIWADGGFGRRGGLLSTGNKRTTTSSTAARLDQAKAVDWKREYKLQHNWAQGECKVEEVHVHEIPTSPTAPSLPQSRGRETSPRTPRRTDKGTMPPLGSKTLVKIADGVAVTADVIWGLRTWDLRSRKLIAQVDVEQELGRPTALAIDAQRRIHEALDIAVGFEHGTFTVWTLDLRKNGLSLLIKHQERSAGKITAVAYRYPYLFSATLKGCLNLYSFGIRPAETRAKEQIEDDSDESSVTLSGPGSPASWTEPESDPDDSPVPKHELFPPQLLTSLLSQSTQEPVALSIRETSSSVVASIAYTFDSWDGWCVGLQDFDIRPTAHELKPRVLTSRVAYTVPITTRSSFNSSFSPPSLAGSSPGLRDPNLDSDGPIRLSYSHPYLLATLPDNTLALHICTTTEDTLTISAPIRLWGHTSGISHAEITPRGKAVSVSTRGEEMRVWELEGRLRGSTLSAGGGSGGKSVEIRPRRHSAPGDTDGKRDWVGFNDEMVIVLKTKSDGQESLMIYDFT